MHCLRNYGFIRILFLLVLFGLCYSAVMAQPASEEEARQLKIDSFIRVTQEQIRRGFYQQAEVQLNMLQTSSDYAPYLSEKQSQTISGLLDKTAMALQERQKIAQMLQTSDTLTAEGRYQQALQILEQIKDSQYATAQEKQMIATTYDEIAAKVQAEQPVQPAQVEQVETVEALIPLVEQTDTVTENVMAQPSVGQVQVMEEEIEPLEMLPLETPEPVEEMSPFPEPEQSQQMQQDQSYLQVIKTKREVLRSYTEAIVSDSLEKAERYLAANEFELAKQAIRRAFSIIEKNKMLLGDTQYKTDYALLSSLDQKIDEVRLTYNQQQAKERQAAATELTQQIRLSMETQRAEAIENYMDRTFAFMDEQRYEEALGQLEQLLAIDPLNQKALILKQSMEHTIRYMEQRDIQKQSQEEELKLLLETQRRGIPYASEINYPRNWKEIAERREAAVAEGLSPADVAVNMQLDKTVDLSMLTEDTTFEEAIDLLRNSVVPPLTIIVLWGDLSENAFIEKDTPINMTGEGLNNIVLRTALKRLLQAVSSGGFAELDYVVEEGVITIATTDSLPTSYRTEIYDVTDLLNPPANWDENNSGTNNQSGGGGGGGGGFGGGGGGSSFGGGGGGGGFGGGGGGYGGGGSSFGGGGGGGSGYGGGGGGSGQNQVGNWQSQYIGYQLIYTIQQTIEPETWYDEGGEGRIDQYSNSKLIIWQTPEIHKQINDFLEKLRADLGQQIAIEARFLLVDENFLEDIGIDTDIAFNLGGAFDHTVTLSQNSSGLVAPTGTGISSSLGDLVSTPYQDNAALYTSFSFENLDDLQVSFIIRATQAHRNAKTLTAPKVAVLNGESATLTVMTQTRLVTDSTPNTETTVANSVSATSFWWTHETEDITSGVTLSVTPVITSDKKYVLMRISAQLVDVLATTQMTATAIVDGEAQTDNYVLPTQQQSLVQTRVTVPDRGTILLGGLTLTADSEMEAGAPVLSKIPILGRLFSNRSEVRDKQILLIMVKPTIVLKDEAEADAMAALEN